MTKLQLVSWASRRGDFWGLSWRQVLPEKPPNSPRGTWERYPKNYLANQSRKMQAFPLRFPASYLPRCCLGQKESLYLRRVFWGHLGLGFPAVGEVPEFPEPGQNLVSCSASLW